MTYTPEEREKAIAELWPYSGTAKMRPDGMEGFFKYMRTAGNVWGRAVELQCHVNALREALQAMYDAARELSCECFEQAPLQQAKAVLAQTSPKEPNYVQD